MDFKLTPSLMAKPDDLARHITLLVRTRLGPSPLTMTWRRLPGQLLIDYFSARGRLIAASALHGLPDGEMTFLLRRLKNAAGVIPEDGDRAPD